MNQFAHTSAEHTSNSESFTHLIQDHGILVFGVAMTVLLLVAIALSYNNKSDTTRK